MPIYEYYCDDTKCNHQFEEVLSISRRDEPITNPCPECGMKTIKKGVSATTMGADMKMTPDKATGGDWSRLMDKVKRSTPPRYHNHIEDTKSNRSGGLGKH